MVFSFHSFIFLFSVDFYSLISLGHYLFPLLLPLKFLCVEQNNVYGKYNLNLLCAPPKVISILPWILKIIITDLISAKFEESFLFFMEGATKSGDLILEEIVGKI